MSIACPFCDSENVSKIVVNEGYQIPFYGETVIPHETYKCHNCQEEGDFDSTLDKKLSKDIDKANLDTAPKIMDSLTRHGITMTYFEKALRLPFRTTARWRRGKLSHSALALLRLVHFSPALLEVADDNFSPEATARYKASRTWDLFNQITVNPTCLVTLDSNNIQIKYSGQVPVMPARAISAQQQCIKWEPVQ